MNKPGARRKPCALLADRWERRLRGEKYVPKAAVSGGLSGGPGGLQVGHAAGAASPQSVPQAQALPVVQRLETEPSEESSAWDAPFYTYYGEAGNLQLELYFDPETGRGRGPGMIGTPWTGSLAKAYYDELERPMFVRCYITHSSLEFYYIYQSESPSRTTACAWISTVENAIRNCTHMNKSRTALAVRLVSLFTAPPAYCWVTCPLWQPFFELF